MAGTKIEESIFTSGQNEGVERSVLPMPQMGIVRNARQRKQGRWGKRYGTANLPVVDSSGNALGSGAGFRRNVGPGFCTVDDKCYIYDSAGQGWVDPLPIARTPATSATVNPWVPGAAPAWLPGSSSYPIPVSSIQSQPLTACSQAVFLGYLWSASSFQKPNGTIGDYVIRVTATNSTDGTLVYSYDVYTTTTSAGDGGASRPTLIACGGTLLIVYKSRVNNAAHAVAARALTTLAGGFGAEVALDASLTATGDYDACAKDSTNFAIVTTSGTQTVVYRLINGSTLATSATRTYTATNNVFGCSIATDAGQPIYSLLSTQNVAVTAGSVDLENFDTTLTTLLTPSNNVVISTPTNIIPPTGYCALLGAGVGVRIVVGGINFPVTTPLENFRSVDKAPNGSGLASNNVTLQFRASLLSRPFNIYVGGKDHTYVWATNSDVGSNGAGPGYGYAYLLRVAPFADFAQIGQSGNQQCSDPVEMVIYDTLVNATNLTPYGLSAPVMLSPGVWAVLLPCLSELPGPVTSPETIFRSVQAMHFTAPAAQLSVNALAADRAQFTPGGCLTRIDRSGAYISGFPVNPRYLQATAVTGAGGSLATNSTYVYSAVYVVLNGQGRAEISGVANPLTVATGTATKVTFSIANLALGCRPGARLEIYRTLANGSIFYLVNTIDAFPNQASPQLGYQTYTDGQADSSIAASKVLYTQVGQTLPNAPPPPCRFGVVGAQRIWLAGLFRADVVQCSKLILGDQSPTFCDNDAFRLVIPSAVTGLAFMDNLVVFTDEGDGGVYVVSGDGPDDSGSGSFSNAIRLPYAIGCIEPRSVISVDEGTFFQSRRGLYMIPRGFGAPIPAGDVVMDTLALFPIITGVAVVTKPGEQAIRWTCVNSIFAGAGVTIVYDLAHKCWSVDYITDVVGGAQQAHIATGQWFGGEVIAAGPANGSSSQVITTTTYDDAAQAINMLIQTGDMRPNGTLSEGVISKVCTLAEVRSACTLAITKQTDIATSPAANRVFALAGGDYQVGQISYTETELGNSEQRDVGSLRVTWSETSTGEGVALVAMAVEHEQGEGLKRVSVPSRTT